MGIKKIKIKNFKSFKDLEVELNDFNIVIGANASGKSNFIHIFEFLRDIVNFGLDNAISMQGDIEYLRNITVGNNENFSIEITADFEEKSHFLAKILEDNVLGIRALEIFYKFTIEFIKSKSKFKIISDELSIKFELLKIDAQKQAEKKMGTGTVCLKVKNREIESKLDISPDLKIDKNDIIPFLDVINKLPEKTLIIETPLSKIPFEVAGIFQNAAVYDFDPKLAKRAISIAGKNELEGDGSNLAIALKNIMKDKDSRKQFSNIISDVLSFVESIDVQKFADKSLLVYLKEIYSKDKLLPASFLSDGTLNIAALIIALYFSKKPLVIIEEPERNIHPHLVSKIVEMMREVSKKKQIIVTTHNSEFLKHARLEDILFIARDKEGFSQVSKPAENEQVKIFLENEMGIDELYVENLLEL
jgi:predicted ATPase